MKDWLTRLLYGQVKIGEPPQRPPDIIVHGEFKVAGNACPYEWADGWGYHHCYKVPDHETPLHVCACDIAHRP